MTKLSGPPEMRRGKRDGKQNSNGKPNNWAMNLSPSNRRLHNESNQTVRVPWRDGDLSSLGAHPWQMPTLVYTSAAGVNCQDFTSISFTTCLTLGIVLANLLASLF